MKPPKQPVLSTNRSEYFTAQLYSNYVITESVFKILETAIQLVLRPDGE